MASGKFSVPESLWEGFSKVVEASASYWSQSDSSLRNSNIVFQFRQPSLNSAKPPWPALCGFALSPELSHSLRFGPNNTVIYLACFRCGYTSLRSLWKYISLLSLRNKVR
jgi:hypothetical protein